MRLVLVMIFNSTLLLAGSGGAQASRGASDKPAFDAATPPDGWDDDAPDESLEQDQASNWYGWQTLLTDAGAVALIVPGLSEESGTLMISGLGVYALGGPVVHMSHGYVAKGFLSLGVRVLGPGAGLLAGSALVDDCKVEQDQDCTGNILPVLGLAAAGVVAASVFDAAVLGKHDALETRRSTSWSVAPVVSLGRGHGGLGLAGSF